MHRSFDPSVLLRILVLAAVGAGAHAMAATDDCKAITDAIGKQMRTPTHAYVTRTSPESGETTSESIFVGGVQYVQQYFTWWRGATLKDIVAREKTIADHVASQCTKLADEPDGQTPAHVFRREDRPKASADGPPSSVLKIWIGVKNGLPLREEFDFGTADGPHSRIVKRFDYDKVRAPNGATRPPLSPKPAKAG